MSDIRTLLKEQIRVGLLDPTEVANAVIDMLSDYDLVKLIEEHNWQLDADEDYGF